MKLKEDMPLLSVEDRGRYFGKLVFCIKTNVIYLPLPPSTSLYLLRITLSSFTFATIRCSRTKRYELRPYFV